ncbi:MAG: copper resistance CopC family protein [Pseudomonadota bacterium]
MSKRTRTFPARAALASLLLTLALPVLAHQETTETSPENGTTLNGSPEQIGVAFDGVMRITQFEVTGPEGVVRLESQPGNEEVERFFAKPQQALPAGDYEVNWRGLSTDGHMMSESFNFSIED